MRTVDAHQGGPEDCRIGSAVLAEAAFARLDGHGSELLFKSGAFVRPPAMFVHDDTGQGRGHQFLTHHPVPLSGVSLDAFPPQVGTRGTIFLTMPDGNVVAPKITDPEAVKGFLDYLRVSNNPAVADTQYFANFSISGDAFAFGPLRDEVINEPLFWVTPDETLNWGMWLLQALPAIYLAEQRQLEVRLLCTQLQQWQADFIRFFAPSYFETLVQQKLDAQYHSKARLFTISRTQRNLALTPFDRALFAQIAEEKGSATSPFPRKKIFISRLGRSSSNPGYRALVNEQELIDALLLQDFHVVEPETLGFADQIALFRDADTVVGLGGAGMFNTIFCRPGTNVITIESSTNWVDAHANIFASAGLKYGVIFGTQIEEGDGVHKRWTVDVAGTAAVLARHV